MATVELKNVKKSFGAADVIHGIDVMVEDGEFIVIVGPSGCGKSTLLRMVAGLETVTSGDVLIGGARANDKEPMDRDIAMVFQNYALYPHMSVRQNMGYGLKIAKMPKDQIEAKVQDAAKLLQLEALLDRKPRQLSGGQRQRVAMGRAIVREPALFLFDEPLSNLDAKLRVQMRLEIKELQGKLGITSLYVTHDQVEAMTIATHVGVLDHGKLVQFGTPREIYENPVSIYAASRLGQPRINILPADLFPNAPPNAKTIGLRPEQIEEGVGEDSFVKRVEHLGDQTRLHLSFKDHDLVTVTEAHTGLNSGDIVKIQPEKPFYFDANGTRIAN